MNSFLIKLRPVLWLLLALPNLVSAFGEGSVDVEVRADIHSSMQMQWQRIEADDFRYQDMKNRLNLDSGWVLLPYGLYAELQTNDARRLISLRVNHLVSTNKRDTIGVDSIFISHNGEKPITATKDLPILSVEDRGLLKTHTFLFVIKTNPTQKPGQYLANFNFISNTLP